MKEGEKRCIRVKTVKGKDTGFGYDEIHGVKKGTVICG